MKKVLKFAVIAAVFLLCLGLVRSMAAPSSTASVDKMVNAVQKATQWDPTVVTSDVTHSTIADEVNIYVEYNEDWVYNGATNPDLSVSITITYREGLVGTKTMTVVPILSYFPYPATGPAGYYGAADGIVDGEIILSWVVNSSGVVTGE